MAARWDAMLRRGVTPEQIAVTVRALQRKGLTVHLIGQSPVFSNNVRVLFFRSGLPVSTPDASARLAISAELNDRLRAELPAGVFIDPLAALCRGRECLYRHDGEFLFSDEGHFSEAGARFAVARYFPYMKEP